MYRDDYARADVPMLPARTTPKQAAWWVMSHTLPTGLAGLLLAVRPELGWFYFVSMVWITAVLFWYNIRLIQTPERPQALRLFLTSNVYLLVLLVAICVDTMLPF